MLNSRFELSKIEKNTRVEREICLATLENREWKENLFLPLSKIESRKRIVSCHSRKSRVEREMGTIKFSRSREKFLFLLSWPNGNHGAGRWGNDMTLVIWQSPENQG